MDNPAFVTASEAAERLGLSLPTVTAMVRDGEIPGVLRATRPYRISRAVFEAWLTTGRVE